MWSPLGRDVLYIIQIESASLHGYIYFKSPYFSGDRMNVHMDIATRPVEHLNPTC